MYRNTFMFSSGAICRLCTYIDEHHRCLLCGRDSDTQLACLQTVIDDSCTDDSVYHNSLQNIANSLSDRCGKSCSAHAHRWR